MEEGQITPYDFTDWQICEINLPRDLPALVDTVRKELRFAFQNFGQGRWTAETSTGKLLWQPDSEIFGDPPPPVFISVDPRQLVPLLIGDLADELSATPEFDVETQEYSADAWQERWTERLGAIKEWKNAILQCEKAMKNMKTERQNFELYEKHKR